MINKICIKVEQIHNYGSFSGFIFKNIFGLPSSMHIQSIDLITYWRLITFLIGRWWFSKWLRSLSGGGTELSRAFPVGKRMILLAGTLLACRLIWRSMKTIEQSFGLPQTKYQPVPAPINSNKIGFKRRGRLYTGLLTQYGWVDW